MWVHITPFTCTNILRKIFWFCFRSSYNQKACIENLPEPHQPDKPKHKPTIKKSYLPKLSFYKQSNTRENSTDTSRTVHPTTVTHESEGNLNEKCFFNLRPTYNDPRSSKRRLEGNEIINLEFPRPQRTSEICQTVVNSNNYERLRKSITTFKNKFTENQSIVTKQDENSLKKIDEHLADEPIYDNCLLQCVYFDDPTDLDDSDKSDTIKYYCGSLEDSIDSYK